MKFRKHNKTRTMPSILLSILASPVSALTMQLGDNTSPASFPSSINATALASGEEVRFVDIMSGAVTGGSPPHGISLGAEAWVFDDISGEMAGVINTATTPGLGADIIDGIAAGTYPPSGDPYGGPGIAQNAVYFNMDFGFLAPMLGSSSGNQHGVATLSIIDSTNFTVHFPVLEGQWGGVFFTYGSATGGLTFICTGAPDASYRCTMEHLINASEDPTSAGFFGSGWALQMDLVSPPTPVAASIMVTDGKVHECSGPTGDTVTADLNTTLPAGVSISTISWTVDGAAAGSGTSITPTLALGNHAVRVDVVTDNGILVSDTVNILVQDTLPPDVNPVVTDVFTGLPVTVLTKITNTTQTFFNVNDVCDSNPVVQGTIGKVLADGDYSVIGLFNSTLRLFSPAFNVTVTASDASGNVSTQTVTLVGP